MVLGNAGSGHALTSGFSVFGYDVTGSTGTLFLYGIVVVAIGMLGLSMLLGGARRTARRGREARSELRQSRRKTAIVSRDRDDLLTSARPITPTRRRKVRSPLRPTATAKPTRARESPLLPRPHLGEFRHADLAAAIRPVRNPSSAICLLKLRGQGLHSAEGG